MLSRSIIQSSNVARAVRMLSTRTATHMTFSAADAQLRPEQVREVLRSMAMADDEHHNDLVYGLSLAQDQGDEEAAWKFSVLTDARMKAQLKHSQNQLKKKMSAPLQQPKELAAPDTAPLPRTLGEALRSSRRAIVITETEAPFRIVDVNRAWSDLCGYSFVESKGKSLGSLLKGPETDTLAATGLISNLLQGEEAGTILVNYAKNGRKFKNRVRVGPIYNGDNKITHFVGVLQEMNA